MLPDLFLDFLDQSNAHKNRMTDRIPDFPCILEQSLAFVEGIFVFLHVVLRTVTLPTECNDTL